MPGPQPSHLHPSAAARGLAALQTFRKAVLTRRGVGDAAPYKAAWRNYSFSKITIAFASPRSWVRLT